MSASSSAKYKAKGVVRSAKNFTKGYSDLEIKVREVTSNDPRNPSGQTMQLIASATHNDYQFADVTRILDKRLNDKGKNWRHVYKALILVDFLLHGGSEKTIHYTKEHVPVIRTLLQFQYVDPNHLGQDRGIVVRTKAREVLDLIEGDGEKRLREDRLSRDMDAFIHDRFKDYFKNNPDFIISTDAMEHSRDSLSTPYKYSPSLDSEDENDPDLKRALELSKQDTGHRPSSSAGSTAASSHARPRSAGTLEEEERQRRRQLEVVQEERDLQLALALSKAESEERTNRELYEQQQRQYHLQQQLEQQQRQGYMSNPSGYQQPGPNSNTTILLDLYEGPPAQPEYSIPTNASYAPAPGASMLEYGYQHTAATSYAYPAPVQQQQHPYHTQGYSSTQPQQDYHYLVPGQDQYLASLPANPPSSSYGSAFPSTNSAYTPSTQNYSTEFSPPSLLSTWNQQWLPANSRTSTDPFDDLALDKVGNLASASNFSTIKGRAAGSSTAMAESPFLGDSLAMLNHVEAPQDKHVGTGSIPVNAIPTPLLLVQPTKTNNPYTATDGQSNTASKDPLDFLLNPTIR